MTASDRCYAAGVEMPDQRTAYQIIAASHGLKAAIEDALVPFGISMTQWTVLVQLLMDPGRSSAQIARSTAVSQQAISDLVARMERNDLLTRRPHPDHGRIQRLAATARGRRVAVEADTRVRELEQALRDHLGEEDAALLRDLLVRVGEFLATRRDERTSLRLLNSAP